MSTDKSWEDHVDTSPKEAKIGDNSMTALEEQVKLLLEAQAKEARLELELKDAQAATRRIAEETLPATLEDLGIEDEVTVRGGIKLKINEKTFITPKKSEKPKLYDWLEKNGHGGMIKRKVVFDVGKDKEEEAKKLVEDTPQFHGSFERDVHHQTLLAFVNGALRDGNDLPIDLLGLHQKKVVEVKVKGD